MGLRRFTIEVVSVSKFRYSSRMYYGMQSKETEDSYLVRSSAEKLISLAFEVVQE